MKREQLKFEISQQCANCSLKKRFRENARSKFFGMRHHRGWESRLWFGCSSMWYVFKESGCLGMQPKMGGKYHLKLNIGERPIANKYREGKMKRTLKRELNSTWNCQKGNVWNQFWRQDHNQFNNWPTFLLAGQHRFDLWYNAGKRWLLIKCYSFQ